MVPFLLNHLLKLLKKNVCVCALLRSFKQDVTGNARAMMKLMNSADGAKHILSTLSSANCFVDSLHDGMDFECNVSRWVGILPSNVHFHFKCIPCAMSEVKVNALTVCRARFELICSSLFNKSIKPIKSLLEQVSLSTSDVNKVNGETLNL